MTIDNIQKLIKGIDETLGWFRANKPEEQYRQQFRDLVAKRLELRTRLETLNDNPGIAAYGESQKGKSYLMSNLLQDNGSPFMVLGPGGREYNYVSELNPPGDGQEATGVVTRFTSFRNAPERYCAQYPVLMRVHRVHELAIILADSYHFDVTDYEQWLDKELEKMTAGLEAKYGERPEVQEIVVEDDIIAIKKYLQNYVNGAQLIYRSDYLDTLAGLIRRVRIDELPQVLAPLWHNQPEVTDLFCRLMDVLKRLDYASEIYLPMDAIEHKEDKPRTIMSVQCLHGLYKDDYQFRTDAYLRLPDGQLKAFRDFNRSHLSAVCREVVLKVEDRYLDCTMSYNTEMIPDDVRRRLPHLEFKRDLLNHADLLDFPGARNREKLFRRNLDKTDADTGEHNMIKLLLRGKIAYLFNHYNSAGALNVLMFCHDTDNVGVTEMYQVIEKWIDSYVGTTPAERAKTINKCDGVPPFFVISTKFNKDMVENNQDLNKNSDAALEQRWKNRFNILYKDVFHAGTDVEWFKSWNADRSKFNNIFVLRDFKYSSTGGVGSNIYSGFGPQSPQEKEMAISEDHFQNMRRTYIDMLRNDSILKGMVADPELSWDLSATINNDGSVYIIDQLTRVASRLPGLRYQQCDDLVNEIASQLVRLLDTIYINPKGKDPIRDAKRDIGTMRLAFDKAANSDNYFFGRLIESLQVTSRETYKVVQKTINDTTVTETVHGSHDWEILRKAIEGCCSKEECIVVLMQRYGCQTEEELRDMTKNIGIDIDDIIGKRGSVSPRVSDVIAERAIEAWKGKINNASTAQRACGNVLDPTPFGILRGKMIKVSERYNLQKVIAGRIASLTDVNNLSTVNQYEVADTVAITINEFVKDWGYSYIAADKRKNMEELDRSHVFHIFEVIDAQTESSFDEDALTALFARLSANANGLSDSFLSSYNRWFAFLSLAFLRLELDGGKVIENPEANDAAGKILDLLKSIK